MAPNAAPNAAPPAIGSGLSTSAASIGPASSGAQVPAPTAPSADSASTTETGTGAATTAGGSTAALAELATLAIKGRAPMTGYTRDQFGPAWPTIAGCDERNDTLRRDLRAITMNDSCEVGSGTLVSPYSATTIDFVRGPQSALVQIDHVVALGDAWQTGAQYWTASMRETFANDPIELLAVDEHSNEQKGDGDAATWLPANKSFRCTYVTLQVDVKAKYGLWVTQAEYEAIASILGNCAGGNTVVVAPTRTKTATRQRRPRRRMLLHPQKPPYRQSRPHPQRPPRRRFCPRTATSHLVRSALPPARPASAKPAGRRSAR